MNKSVLLLALIVLATNDVLYADREADFGLSKETYIAGETLQEGIAIKNLEPPLVLQLSASVWCEKYTEVECDELQKQLPPKIQTWAISRAEDLNPPDRMFDWSLPKSLSNSIPFLFSARITRPGSDKPLYTRTVFGKVLPSSPTAANIDSQVLVLILQSTREYEVAKQTAIRAAKDLSVELDLRGLAPHSTLGLSLDEKGCQENGATVPCYFPRVASPDGDFVSVEYSDRFRGFRPGYYIVVAAMVPKRDPERAEKLLITAKAKYSDAYIKSSEIHNECGH